MTLRPWIAALRLVLALVVLASAILRPPGTMLDRFGDSVSYVICTGAETHTITVSLTDGHVIPPGSEAAACDFFAHQIATAPDVAPMALALTNQQFSRLVVVAEAVFTASVAHRAHAPRGPPALI